MKLSNLVVFVALLCFAESFSNMSGYGTPLARRVSPNPGRCAKLKTIRALKGVIKFPLVGNYGSNLNCAWQITVPAGRRIRLKVESISIEAPEDCATCCWFDWLSLYDGRTASASSLMAKLCGTTAKRSPFITKTNAALVTFRSNSQTQTKGFTLSYQVIWKTSASSGAGACNGKVLELSSPSGELRSPGFDEKRFPDNAQCRWTIAVPAKKVIQVFFEIMNIGIDDTCVNDVLSFYDGRDMSAPLLGTYCGNRLPPDFITSGNALFISFELDSNWSEGQFSIRWTAIDEPGPRGEGVEGCNGMTAVLHVQQGDGVLTSPNYGSGRKYPNGAKCSWRIVVAKSLKVLLKFEKFSLEPQLEDAACSDVLSVYDGPSVSSPIFGSFCGLRAPSDMMSNSNEMYLEFKSDEGKKAPGFLIKYSAKGTSRSASSCGVPDVLPKMYSRIIGGVESTPHSWPWLVQIELLDGYEWRFWCGAAVIYPQWILTAAHCVKPKLGPKTNFKLIIGDHSRLKEEGTEQTWKLDEIFVHENYDDVTNNNDIALVRLPSKLQYDHNVKPLCLPKTDVQENVLCIVAGWGQTRSTGVDGILYQLAIPVINRNQCNAPNWYDGRVTDNMFCAGYPEGRRDSCQGDSGGPLVCLSQDTWVASGLTSFGEGCALAKHPGVYTRVTKYLNWIKKITGV